MRIECPSCHKVVSATLTKASPHEATFACGACGAPTTISVVKRKVDTSVGGDGDGACPKCGHSIAGASHCPACGLDTEHFLGFDTGTTQASPQMQGWEAVDSHWSADSEHEKFVSGVVASGSYRLAARCYKHAETDPERAAKAGEMLDRIRSMATAALLSSKPKLVEEKEPYRGVLILLMVMLLLGAGVGVILMSGDRAGSDTTGSSHSESENR